MKQPDWQITITGQKVPIADRLISLVINDNRSLEADRLTLVLSDRDHRLNIPRRGVELSVAIGYKGSPLVERGLFVVDTARHSGPPDQITIESRSANLQTQRLKSGKEKSWHGQKLGEIIKSIAAAHDMPYRIADKLAGITLDHIDQKESDAHFLTRLAERYGALATIKAGRLLFLQVGVCKTMQGEALKPIQITRQDADTHDFALDETQQHKGVQASWHNKKTGKRNTVYAGGEGKGGEGERKKLPGTYPTEEAAKQAAQAEWEHLQRQKATISLSIAEPPPDLFAESPLSLSGYGKPEIDNNQWLIKQVTMTIDSNALTASLNAETRV